MQEEEKLIILTMDINIKIILIISIFKALLELNQDIEISLENLNKLLPILSIYHNIHIQGQELLITPIISIETHI